MVFYRLCFGIYIGFMCRIVGLKFKGVYNSLVRVVGTGFGFQAEVNPTPYSLYIRFKPLNNLCSCWGGLH